MPIFNKTPHYHSYLLRFWVERLHESEELIKWRFSLEETREGKRYGFTDLAELITYLELELARMTHQDDANQNHF